MQADAAAGRGSGVHRVPGDSALELTVVHPEAALHPGGHRLVQSAVFLSLECGYLGRVGLHSLPQADRFYLRCGMTDLGQDSGCESLRYWEMTPDQAENFVK